MDQHVGRAAAIITTCAAICTATAVPALAAPPRGAGHPATAGGFARLDALNRSGAAGVVHLSLRGTMLDVQLYTDGLLPAAPHAMHIHAGGAGTCPTMADDTNHDGIVSTTEGHHAYGMVVTSLTLRGDTSPGSVLAVDRYPTAAHGYFEYRRSITVDSTVADQIRAGNAVIVVHGIDPNGDGRYDGTARSDLDPMLPLEATSPALCGSVHVYRG